MPIGTELKRSKKGQVRGHPSLSRLASLGPGTNSSRLLEGPLLAKRALTGTAGQAGAGGGEAQAQGGPGGRAVAEARLRALEGCG